MARIKLDEKERNYKMYKASVKDFIREGYITREARALAAKKHGVCAKTIFTALTYTRPKSKRK